MADPVSPVAVPVSPASATAPGEHVHTLDHVDHYLRVGQESGASDIHLGVNALPIWRRFGTLEPIWLQADRLSAADTQRLALGFLDEEQKALLEQRGDVILPTPPNSVVFAPA
jgi:twitching motility protein PilT